MARPLRLEFAGALYHVTARGNARESIFLADEERYGFLDLFGKEIDWQVPLTPLFPFFRSHADITPRAGLNVAPVVSDSSGEVGESVARRHDEGAAVSAKREHVALVAGDEGIGLTCLGECEQVVVVRVRRDIDDGQGLHHRCEASHVVDHAPRLGGTQAQPNPGAASHSADFFELLLTRHQHKAAVAPSLVELIRRGVPGNQST